MGLGISELADDVLRREYEKSTKSLMSLDAAAPEWVREIRVMYHQYLTRELADRHECALMEQLARVAGAVAGDASDRLAEVDGSYGWT